MKRALIIAISLGLMLAGCGGGKKVGDDDILNFKETQSASATPTPSKTKKPSAKPTPTKSSAKPDTQSYCPKKPARLAILNISDGFSPRDLRVVKGCKVIFTNKDPDRKHSWVSGNGVDPKKDGDLWKSPVLDPGESWTWVVDAPANKPGETYQCHDGEVPYVLCDLQILEVKR